jgi:hypothetical protein
LKCLGSRWFPSSLDYTLSYVQETTRSYDSASHCRKDGTRRSANDFFVWADASREARAHFKPFRSGQQPHPAPCIPYWWHTRGNHTNNGSWSDSYPHLLTATHHSCSFSFSIFVTRYSLPHSTAMSKHSETADTQYHGWMDIAVWERTSLGHFTMLFLSFCVSLGWRFGRAWLVGNDE